MPQSSPLTVSALGFAALCLAVACDPDATAPPDGTALTFVNVSAGWSHTCGLTSAGAAYCWGAGGALGDGTTSTRLTPAAVAMPAAVTFTSLSAGGYYTCGRTPAGAVYCWGFNAEGQVGDGTMTTRLTPVAVVMPAGVTFTSMSSDATHTCGLTAAGVAHCWGDNAFGQLGDGTTTTRLTPTVVAMPAGVAFTNLVVGRIHSCGLSPAGVAYCWGSNGGDGPLGDGTTTDRLTPTAVAMPAGVTFASIAVGDLHSCGLTREGAAYCWGGNARGRLGDGTTTGRPTPVTVVMPAGVTFTSLVAGYANSCGLTPSGAAYCWGRNGSGELGDGTTTDRLIPTAVMLPAGVTFTSLAVGFVHTCGLTAAGATYCWGVNDSGRLGDGTTTNRLTPAAVVQ